MKRQTPKSDYRSLALSLALHVALGVLVLRAAVGSDSMFGYFRRATPQERPASEKVIYVPLARGGADSTRTQADGGNNRLAAPNVISAAPLRAPISIPTMLPPATPKAPQSGNQEMRVSCHIYTNCGVEKKGKTSLSTRSCWQ